MTATRARVRTVGLLVAVVVVAVLGLTIAPAASAIVTTGTAETAETAETEASSDESAPNATVSSFMQSTAADAEHTVESGMFEAQYENADDDRRAALVAERVDDLEAELETLRAERNELNADAAADNPGRYRARMTKLTVEIAGLERAIERTERRADEAGVEDERLAELKANASELADTEVTKTAQGLAGFDRHPGAGNGPPDDRGATGDGSQPGQAADDRTPPGHEQSAANQTGPGQATGPSGSGNGSDHPGNGAGNGSSDGAPGKTDGGDKRDGSDSSGGQGPPDDDSGDDAGGNDDSDDDSGGPPDHASS